MSLVIALTPNPALDLTYRVPQLEPGGVHRLESVARRAGGKGLNVARVAAILTSRAIALAPVDQANEAFFRADCEAVGAQFIASARASAVRQSFAITPAGGGETTVFNETGEPLTDGEWDALTATTIDVLSGARAPGDQPVLTVSGSVPPSTEPEAVESLIRQAAALAPVLVDMQGPSLLASARAGATLVKCNVHELAEATGTTSLDEGLGFLFRTGAQRALITLGADGMLLATPTSRLQARLNTRIEGNATGAGDAALAALAVHWFDDEVSALTASVAVSAASVLKPTAGDVDPGEAKALAAAVQIDHP